MYLDQIMSPKDLRNFPDTVLPIIADELRYDIIRYVSQTGGHLGASLGVVELTIALHYVFDTPYDRLIWDVGHQAYAHKILTGRRALMGTIRKNGGLSGFTKRSESIFDPFGAGHSSTSISSGLGMAIAAHKRREKRHIISVIGDGAMSAGIAFEALNNAGVLNAHMLVILNDNEMSIAPPVGAMSRYLSQLLTSSAYHHTRRMVKRYLKNLPFMPKAVKKIEQLIKTSKGTVFESLGFYYVGPVNGHDLSVLVPLLENIRSLKECRPILLHVITQKGKGYSHAENSCDKFHGVGSFDIKTGVQKKENKLSFTEVFAKSLIELADQDKEIVAITAAMPSGTGLALFGKKYPDRMFDVGIAEQHAVTFAAGLASEGYKPFVAIYSTFLQRAYDQIIHDVVLQSLPVRFMIDRAGFVGEDGATHCGAYDIAFLSCLPNVLLVAPRDSHTLRAAVKTVWMYHKGPSFVRYPRGSIPTEEVPNLLPWTIGTSEILQHGSDIAFIGVGPKVYDCLKAARLLREKTKISATVVDARFIKPIDKVLISDLKKKHKLIVTVEEGSVGGFGHYVLAYLGDSVLIFSMPDRIIEHGSVKEQIHLAKLDSQSIMERTWNVYRKKFL